MTRSTPTLLALTLVLACIIARECRDIPTSDVSPSSQPNVGAVLRLREDPLETQAQLERRQAQVAAIMARPLFSPDRRPPSSAAAVSAKTPIPRLTGILVSRTSRRAIFMPAPGGKALAVSEGDHLGMFVVSTIATDGVTMLDSDGVAQVMHPLADPTVRAAVMPVIAVPVARLSVLSLLQSMPGRNGKPSFIDVPQRGPPR